MGVRFPLSPPTAIPHMASDVPDYPHVVAERRHICAQPCPMNPPLSRVKCGNMCGNRFRLGGTAVALSATRAKALKEPGRYSDGGGLHLFISKRGAKSWVQRITIDGRRRDVGLGGFPTVSLAQARGKAADNRAAVAEGRDPLAEKHAPAMPTFGRPLTPSTRPTSHAGATPGTSLPGFRPWSGTPYRSWAVSLWTR